MYNEPLCTDSDLTLLTATFTPRDPPTSARRLLPRNQDQHRQDEIGALNRLLAYEVAAVDAYRYVLALFPVLRYVELKIALMESLGGHHQRAKQLRGYLFKLGHHPAAALIQAGMVIQISNTSGTLLDAHDVLTALADMERQGVTNYCRELCYHLDEHSGNHIHHDLLPAQERTASTLARLCDSVTISHHSPTT